MSEDKPYTVRILDNDYRVACPPDEQSSLDEAAQYLNETMVGIRDTGKVTGSERVAVMAALNMSYELLGMRQQAVQQDEALQSRLRKLLQQLDANT